MSKSETDEQSELDQFKTALEIRDQSDDEKPSWEPRQTDEPDTGSRVQCEHCDNMVLKDFARVFGDNENRLINGCPECTTFREFAGGDGK